MSVRIVMEDVSTHVQTPQLHLSVAEEKTTFLTAMALYVMV